MSQGSREEAFISSFYASPIIASDSTLIILAIFGLIFGIVSFASDRAGWKATLGVVINVSVILYVVFLSSQQLETRHNNQEKSLLEKSGVLTEQY